MKVPAEQNKTSSKKILMTSPLKLVNSEKLPVGSRLRYSPDILLVISDGIFS
jgi:hypothetical protein